MGWEKQLKRRDIFFVFGLMVILMLREGNEVCGVGNRSGDLVFWERDYVVKGTIGEVRGLGVRKVQSFETINYLLL